MHALMQPCPRCGFAVPPAARYCPACGLPAVAAAAPYAPGLPAYVVNSHAVGFLILSFLLSFLWFRINRVGVFPLGFVGALVVA